ncbi:MAG: hypothetical protein KFH87_11090 [Bacteroidetes bacterium]|nr:hypothetical protein [Bacteroidota bacterium]
MSDYHEPVDEMDAKARSLTRALNSLKEEIEAVDWYNQRVSLETDDALKDILHHNMIEEIEHACMTLEWLRRNMDGWNDHLKTFLFKEDEIAH